MTVTESLTINGRAFIRTYSDSSYMVERDGVMYSEAIDPAEMGRTYTETDEATDATEGDYRIALAEMGVQV